MRGSYFSMKRSNRCAGFRSVSFCIESAFKPYLPRNGRNL
jgi:hypothetical protein